MGDDILHYYERELSFIREMGGEFARKYPKIAGRLLLDGEKCDDPHTERLIEAFALLCGRVHKKIDDDFPEVTESFFQILYPHYTSPIPSMSIVAFDPVKTAIPPSGYSIPSDTPLYSRQVNGMQCQFKTRYPVTLWPVEVVSASLRDPRKTLLNAQQALVITIKTTGGVSMSQLEWRSLRFFLNGQSQHVLPMYELLFNNATSVEFVGQNQKGLPFELRQNGDAVRPVGFSTEEAMLPATGRSFPGYLLLTEYFCFQEKFLFFDVAGLEKLSSLNLQDTLEIWINFDHPAKMGLAVSGEMFALNAAPIINLFSRTAEPVQITHEKTEYPVIPDVRRQDFTEIFSIDRVASLPMSKGGEKEFRPYYSLSHHSAETGGKVTDIYWHTRRAPSGRYGDDGTDMTMSFAGLDFNAVSPDAEILMVQTTCTNRDLPVRMRFGDPAGDFETEIAAPVTAIRCLVKPTRTRRTALDGSLQWRLISHLALNYTSIVSGGEEALKEILRMYDFDNSPSTRQQISGIVSLSTGYATKRVGRSFCRGVQVEMTFDEEKFVGSALYLFAGIIERFIGQYVSVNSFSQLVVKTLQRKEIFRIWPPRNGDRVLL
jgi:type VI secretion system protein ImpG